MPTDAHFGVEYVMYDSMNCEHDSSEQKHHNSALNNRQSSPIHVVAFGKFEIWD